MNNTNITDLQQRYVSFCDDVFVHLSPHEDGTLFDILILNKDPPPHKKYLLKVSLVVETDDEEDEDEWTILANKKKSRYHQLYLCLSSRKKKATEGLFLSYQFCKSENLRPTYAKNRPFFTKMFPQIATTEKAHKRREI